MHTSKIIHSKHEGNIMSQKEQLTSIKSTLSMYVTWGIIIGSIAGLFAGIFWFEMGLSLLFGTAAGLIVGTALGFIFGNKTKQSSSA
jgi:hypothetical protein